MPKPSILFAKDIHWNCKTTHGCCNASERVEQRCWPGHDVPLHDVVGNPDNISKFLCDYSNHIPIKKEVLKHHVHNEYLSAVAREGVQNIMQDGSRKDSHPKKQHAPQK